MNTGRALLGGLALVRRELLRTLRQPSRVVASIGTPVLLWALLAAGLSASVTAGSGGDYSTYLLPGVLALTAIFTGIFSAMSLIDDRHSGVLQAALASPLPRWALASSKILGGGLGGFAQVAVLVALSPLLGASADPLHLLMALVIAAALCAAVTGMCLALAWVIDSAQGFHGVMNLVLMPMWLLSGAFYPVDGAQGWIRVVTTMNPLTPFLSLLRWAMVGAAPSWHEPLYAGLFLLASFAVAWTVVGRRAV